MSGPVLIEPESKLAKIVPRHFDSHLPSKQLVLDVLKEDEILFSERSPSMDSETLSQFTTFLTHMGYSLDKEVLSSFEKGKTPRIFLPGSKDPEYFGKTSEGRRARRIIQRFSKDYLKMDKKTKESMESFFQGKTHVLTASVEKVDSSFEKQVRILKSKGFHILRGQGNSVKIYNPVAYSVFVLESHGFEFTSTPDGSFSITNNYYVPDYFSKFKPLAARAVAKAKSLAQKGQTDKALYLHGLILEIVDVCRLMDSADQAIEESKKYGSIRSKFIGVDPKEFEQLFGVSYNKYREKGFGLGGIAREYMQNAKAACSDVLDSYVSVLHSTLTENNSRSADDVLFLRNSAVKPEANYYFERAMAVIEVAKAIREVRLLKSTKAEKKEDGSFVFGFKQVYDLLDVLEQGLIQNPEAKEKIKEKAERTTAYLEGLESLYKRLILLNFRERRILQTGDFKSLEPVRKELGKTLTRIQRYSQKSVELSQETFELNARAIYFEEELNIFENNFDLLIQAVESGVLVPLELSQISDLLDQMDEEILQTKDEKVEIDGEKKTLKSIKKIKHSDASKQVLMKLMALKDHLSFNEQIGKKLDYDVEKLRITRFGELDYSDPSVYFLNQLNGYIGSMSAFTWGALKPAEGATKEEKEFFEGLRKKYALYGLESFIYSLMPMELLHKLGTTDELSTLPFDQLLERLDKITAGEFAASLLTAGKRGKLDAPGVLIQLVVLYRMVESDSISLDKAHEKFKATVQTLGKRVFEKHFGTIVFKSLDEVSRIAKSPEMGNGEKGTPGVLFASVASQLGVYDMSLQKGTISLLEKYRLVEKGVDGSTLRSLSADKVGDMFSLTSSQVKAVQEILNSIEFMKDFAWVYYFKKAETTKDVVDSFERAKRLFTFLEKEFERLLLPSQGMHISTKDYRLFKELKQRLERMDQMDPTSKEFKKSLELVSSSYSDFVSPVIVEALQDESFEKSIKEYGFWKRSGYRTLKFLDDHSTEILATAAAVGFIAGVLEPAPGDEVPAALATREATKRTLYGLLSRFGIPSMTRIRMAIHSSVEVFGATAKTLGAVSMLPFTVGTVDYFKAKTLDDPIKSLRLEEESREMMDRAFGHAIWGLMGGGRMYAKGFATLSRSYNYMFNSMLGLRVYSVLSKKGKMTPFDYVSVGTDAVFLSIPAVRGVSKLTRGAVRRLRGWTEYLQAPQGYSRMVAPKAQVVKKSVEGALSKLPKGDLVFMGLSLFDDEVTELFIEPLLVGAMGDEVQKMYAVQKMQDALIPKGIVSIDPAVLPSMETMEKLQEMGLLSTMFESTLVSFDGESKRRLRKEFESVVLGTFEIASEDLIHGFLDSSVQRNEINTMVLSYLKKQRIKIPKKDEKRALDFFMEYIYQAETDETKKGKITEMLEKNPEVKDKDELLQLLFNSVNSWLENDPYGFEEALE